MNKVVKNTIIILAIFIVSLSLSYLIELFYYNKNVLKINNKYKPLVVETQGIEKNNNHYTTTSNNSYIKIQIKDKYINKLKFNYKTNEDISYIFKYKNSNGEKIKINNSSSLFITKSIKVLNDKTNTLKIEFEGKNIQISNIEVDNQIVISWIRIFIICSSIFIGIILIKYRKFLSSKLEIAFMLIGLVAGIAYIIGTPKTVFNSWDDQIHIKNSQVFNDSYMSHYSEGFQLLASHKIVTSNQISSYEEKKELYKVINQLDKDTNNMKIQVNNYDPKYSKIIYTPFKLGFIISDFLKLGLIEAIVVSKFFNLLLYLLIMLFAIKVSNESIKKIIFVIGLLVSNVFLATQFSCDSTITASLVLATSLFVRMLEDKEINYKYLIAFILAVIWASLPKAIYCFFGLLIVFIPNKKFKNNKQAIGIKIAVTSTVILLMSTFVLPMLMGGVEGDARGGNTNASAQFSLILHSPINYIKILCSFYLKSGVTLFLGSGTLTALGYIGKIMPDVNNTIYIITLIYLLYVTFTNGLDKKIVPKSIKVVLFILIFGISLLIPTALYLSFTEVGSNTIQGVQARYYISLLLPLMIIFNPYGKNNKKTHEYIPIFSFVLLMFTILYIQRITIGI